ncbi:MAG TPA: transglutaminase-like domain-containing protein, partial [Anaerolineales bacterium]
MTAATRLVVTHWTDNLALVQTIAVFGCVTGLALGASRFSHKLAFLIGLAYGLFVVPWQLGLTYDPSFTWDERMFNLYTRLQTILSQLANREVVQDSLLFITLMAVLFWILSVHAGYTLSRYGNAWRSILPAGLALFVIHSFDALNTRSTWYLAVYLFFSLVLVARAAYLHQHSHWQESRTALPPHLGLDFIRFTLLATSILVIFAWTAPALANTLPAAEKAFQTIKQPWNNVRSRMNNAFASLRSSAGVVSDYYGSSMLLGRGNRLTDIQVFSVKPPDNAPLDIRYYWRARVYDTYVNGQWISSSHSETFDPAKQVVLPKENARWLGSFSFISAGSITTLFSPAQPLWVNQSGEIDLSRNPDGSVDLASFRVSPSLQAGNVYQVQAYLSNATIAQMRAAGNSYPSWVTDRYLQLPASITARTRQLAQDLTKDIANPYDKVAAITNYLRNNIAYSEILPDQPSNQESIDWFLFDIKEGFCNYYSSAEVVMLRSIGIPARWAVGFAQGERLSNGMYLVRERDAHAWPEVFFPNLGWIEFEPTASQPSLVRQPGQAGETVGASSLPDQAAKEDALLKAQQEELASQRKLKAGGTGSDILNGTLSGPVNFLIWIVPLAAAILLLYSIIIRPRVQRLNLPPAPVIMEQTLVKVGIRPPNFLRQWARRASLPPLTRSYLERNAQ